MINKTANVNEEKTERVLKAIEETGFKPNEVARMLFKGSSKLLGLVVPNIENPFFSQMARVIEQEAYEKGYQLILCSSEDDPEKEAKNLDLLDRMNAEGVMILVDSQSRLKESSKLSLPIVVLDRPATSKNEIASVHSDNYEGGRIAARHLIEKGCRTIACVTGPVETSSARERVKGFMHEMEDRGLEPVVILSTYRFDSGIEAGEKLLSKHPEVDGIMAANDVNALGIYQAYTKKGIRIPQDVKLIGYDDVELARMSTPGLTTVRQDISAIGKKAVRLLIDYISGNEVEKISTLPVSLIERETT